MRESIINTLIVISGICWSVVYVNAIHTGFKQKTCCMPLFALGLNIAWEGIYAYTDLFVRGSITAQAVANTVWFLLDILIVVTWFKFGREEMQDEQGQKAFLPWSILVLAVCFALQILFIAEFGDVQGEKYSAYLQNIAMSVAYLYMLGRRKSSRGQTMLIAVCKCIGTLTPTIYGTMEGNTFILVTGVICFLFDVIYIWCLHNVKQKEFTREHDSDMRIAVV
ncbi:MAG: hypothetical protein ACI3VN_06600 [Candidatus Onthomonas sp.]